MPTTQHGHVRRLLKARKAHVVKRCPFTIQLDYETTNYTQEITLGVDAGSKTIGLSATTEKDVLYESEVILRNDIVKKLSQRRELRRGRRGRKTRYRKPRFNNRKKPKGWLAPSVENKIQTHLTVIRNVTRILPVTRIVVEVASFNIQKIKAIKAGKPALSGTDYQHGDQLGFWNVREYVLFRDGHVCQCCKGKSKDPILNVHHIESRQTGGDAPNNLITLCETCHTNYHKGLIALPKNIRRGMSFRDAVFMGIMRWALYDELKATYDNVSLTYGYITKDMRIRNGLPKEHRVDARCISGNPIAIPPDEYFLQRKVRRHNRQLHKMTIGKGGKRRNNQAPRYVHGFQLFDKVRCGKVDCFVFGRRMRGFFSVRLVDGTIVSSDVSCKRLSLLERRKTILVERRRAAPPHT
jgi:N6-L-threonylcarbamoyladenine synthase